MGFFNKTKTYKITGTTRDIGKMLYESTLQDDQKNLIENYVKNNYLKESKKALDKLEETEKNYKAVLENKETIFDSVLDTAREKTLETTFNLMLPGVIVDNLAAKLLANTANSLLKDLRQAETEKEAYDKYYDAIVDGIDLAQRIGTSIREEDFYYHIGVGNSSQITVFQLDLDLMHQFEKDKNIFEVTKNEKGNFVFRTKIGLTEEDIFDGLKDAYNITGNLTKEENNLMQNIWSELRQDQSLVKKSGRQINPADRFELFESNIIDYQYKTNNYQNDLEKMRKDFKHDYTSGYAAGDRTFFVSDNNEQKRLGIQSKFFNTDLEDEKRKFNITSVNSLKEALSIYSDKKTMEKLVKKEEVRALKYIGERDTAELPDDIVKDAEAAEEFISENYEGMAEEESINWIEDNW